MSMSAKCPMSPVGSHEVAGEKVNIKVWTYNKEVEYEYCSWYCAHEHLGPILLLLHNEEQAHAKAHGSKLKATEARKKLWGL